MAALDRNNLVRDGKYNRAEIMRRAWAYYKNRPYSRYTFKQALHTAWVDAQLLMDEIKLEAKPLEKPHASVNVASLYALSSSMDMRNGTVCW